jgi:hypothetical protein
MGLGLVQPGALASLVLVQMICLAPYIVWVIIGAQEINAVCNQYDASPNLAVWLVVEGSVGIFSSLSSIMIAFFRNRRIFFLYSVLLNCFFLAWSILGVVRLVQDQLCEWHNTRLYSTAFAAVVVGIVGIVTGFCQTAKQEDL